MSLWKEAEIEMMSKIRNYKKYIPYFLFFITPVFALLLLCIIQRISLFEIDWWNSTWNDEVIYHKIVKMMREYGYPTGVCSYNEIEPQYPAYGTWIITAYIPYWLVSFLTGIHTHGFMVIANVLMVVIANIAFCLLARPKGWQIFFLSMFCKNQLYSKAQACGHAQYIIKANTAVQTDSLCKNHKPEKKVVR